MWTPSLSHEAGEKRHGDVMLMFFALRRFWRKLAQRHLQGKDSVYLGLLHGADGVRADQTVWPHAQFLVIWYHLVLLSDFRGQLGITVKTHRAMPFLTCCLWSQETQPSPLSAGTHGGGTLRLVQRERPGAESHTVCPVCAGAVLNITRSYFFRNKSNRAWASGQGNFLKIQPLSV